MDLVVDIDSAVSTGVHEHAGAPLVSASGLLTMLGGTEIAALLTLAAVAALVVARETRAALAVALAVGVTQVVVFTAKQVVERPRPAANETLAQADGFSFPSGHAATGAVLFGILTLLAASRLTGAARTAVCAMGMAVIAAVGATRVVLGAHYPSDVLAGWLIGLTIAAAAVLPLLRATRALMERQSPGANAPGL